MLRSEERHMPTDLSIVVRKTLLFFPLDVSEKNQLQGVSITCPGDPADKWPRWDLSEIANDFYLFTLSFPRIP